MNERGGIVDDLLIYCLQPNSEYLLIVNASNVEKDFAHFARYAPTFGVRVGEGLQNISDETAQLAVQGPKAMEVLQTLTDTTITDMPYYTFKVLQMANVPDVIFATTGYTGAGGAEIYFPNKYSTQLWDAIMSAGKAFGIAPVGLGARDTLRLEMGYCLYGHELSDDITPLEAGLAWITKFSKSFLGDKVLLQQKADGVPRRLIGFKLKERGVPREGYEICTADGTVIGNVTSGTMSPTLNEGIGMGYVNTGYGDNSTVYIKIRGVLKAGEVVKMPFRKREGRA
jgi:aminomethyltransferase